MNYVELASLMLADAVFYVLAPAMVLTVIVNAFRERRRR